MQWDNMINTCKMVKVRERDEINMVNINGFHPIKKNTYIYLLYIHIYINILNIYLTNLTQTHELHVNTTNTK